MRNILEYPPTKEEVVELLTRLAETKSNANEAAMVCGDMEPYLLAVAAEVINAHGLDVYLKRMERLRQEVENCKSGG